MVTFRLSLFRKSRSLSVVKRLKCPFIRCDTSGCAIPRTLAISRCFSFLPSRILKTWNPICARASNWSASLRPRSAKTFPDPSSNLVGFRFFVFTCQLLCFGVSPLDQLNVSLRCCNTFLRFLLEGMQHIDPLADLQRNHDTIGVRGVSQRNLYDSTAEAPERFGIFRHAAK